MANFKPLKKHFIFCLDQAIHKHQLKGPFLDAGCGTGDVSLHLAKKGWFGKAIDSSPSAVKETRQNLLTFKGIKVERKTLFQVNGSFRSVFLFDVLEHLKDDKSAIKKIFLLLQPGGHLVITVPSNPCEWAWDDEFYGHYRRYKPQEIADLLSMNRFKMLTIWDCTFPLYWLMRRIYVKLLKPPKITKGKRDSTRESSVRNAWEIPLLTNFLSELHFIWKIISIAQFLLFRNFVDKGHEMIVVVKKEYKK